MIMLYNILCILNLLFTTQVIFEIFLTL